MKETIGYLRMFTVTMKKTMSLAVLLLAAAASLAAETLTFQVVGIDCASCGPPVMRALTSVEGVQKASVDVNRKTATVNVPAGFDRNRLRASLSNAGFDAVFPGETRTEMEPLSPAAVKALDLVTFTDGHRVDLTKVVAPGKITIVDFYGDWCGPCRVLETRLEHLMQGRKNLALRRVNIGHWDNDAAKQATALKATALPYVRLYDAHGKFVTAVTGGMWDEVLAAIEKAGQ